MVISTLFPFVRTLLSVTLLVAGVGKLVGLEAFCDTLSSVGVPRAARRCTAIGIAIAEITLGVGLWVPVVHRWAALVSAFLLGAFSLAGLLFDSRRVRCNCFGPLFDDRLGKGTAIRNLPLVVGAFWIGANASPVGTFGAFDGMIYILAAAGLILIEPLLRQPGR